MTQATTTNALHTRMAAHVSAGVAPGLVTAIARGGRVEVDAIGRTAFDAEPDSRPMGADTLFRITSMTKPVVAVATLLLVEDGTLHLDEAVDDLLPELADRRVLSDPTGALDDTVPAARPITVEDLLSYRAGFGFDLDLGFPTSPYFAAAAELGLAVGPPVPGSPHAPDEWLRRLGTLPLLAQPGARWLYDTSADVLGVLVARAAGASLPDVLAHHVFRPLGMRDTAFHVSGPDSGRLAACYADAPAGGPERVDDGGRWTRPPAFPAGSCGLLSTAGDYARFATALAAGDLLAPTTVARMRVDRLAGPQHGSMLLGDRGWGLGVAVDPAGRYGWDGGFGTSWFTDPATGGVAVLMTQRMFCEPLMRLMGDFRESAISLFEQ